MLKSCIKFLKKKFSKSPVNIGYENTVSIKELAKKICTLANKTPKFVYNIKKPEGRFVKSSDSKLLKKITSNYKPVINLDNGLKLMLEWYKKKFRKV